MKYVYVMAIVVAAAMLLSGCGLTTKDYAEVGGGLAVDTVLVDAIGSVL